MKVGPDYPQRVAQEETIYTQIGAVLAEHSNPTYLSQAVNTILAENSPETRQQIDRLLKSYSKTMGCRLLGVSCDMVESGQCDPELSQRITQFTDAYTKALKILFGIPPSPHAQSPAENNPSSTP